MSLYPQPLLDVHDELIVDLFAGGGGASSSEQVRMCGNSVSPLMAESLVAANCPEMIVRRVIELKKRVA